MEIQTQAFNRSDFLSHIDRYHLFGVIDSVAWDIAGSENLNVGFVSPDNTIVGNLHVEKLPFDREVEVGIMQTSKLKKLLRILNDTFSVSFQTQGEQTGAIVLEDDHKTVQFRLSELSATPSVPNIKKLPDFNAQLELTEEFTNAFRDAEKALEEGEFAVRKKDEDSVEVIVGYTQDDRRKHNNKVTIPLSASDSVDSFGSSPVVFRSDVFADLFKANKDAEGGTWEVSGEGLSRVVFEGEGWDVTYYIIGQQ